MTALPQDAVADLQRRIAELERQLDTAVDERDAAVERQTASALVNFRLKNELRAAAERQKASNEILNAIANTHGHAEHALQRIAEATRHFFGSASVTIRVAEGDRWTQTVRVGSSSHLTGAQPTSDAIAGGANLPATVYRENRQIHIPDLDNVAPSMTNWPVRSARAAGIRTVCASPLRRGEKAIGALIVYRDRLAPFTDDELALQQSFADQAVIAIENARLFNETEKALARQTATSDILRVISSSPTDVQPVFDEIVLTAARLLRCDRAFIQRHDAGSFWTVAAAGQQGPLTITVGNRTLVDPDANFPSRAIVAKETLHLPDWSAIELPEFERRIRDLHGNSSALYMPLLRSGECIGLLALLARQANQFGASEIALAESFRDQALIAIENTRLFNETQEALERQTATADILKVIASSPADVQPVFEAIAERSNKLLGGLSTAVYSLVEGMQHLMAFTHTSPAADEALRSMFPRPLSAAFWAEAIGNGEVFQIANAEVDLAAHPTHLELARLRGWQSVLLVPLLRGRRPIGLISVTRAEHGRFTDRHVQLLKTFADQAVIAIENTRLFNETREALERQTATADILKVIASSPSDVQPVFDAIAHSANRLLGGFSSTVFRLIDGMAHLKAFTPVSPEADEVLKSSFPAPVTQLAPLRAMQSGKVMQITDTEGAEHELREIARARGYRSMVWAPLMNKGESIGFIAVTRVQPGSFVDHHIQLLQTFADQAVIAIENTRLFNEVQAKTHDLEEALRYQTGSANILNVIASSPTDVEPVLRAIVESASDLCGADDAIVLLKDSDGLRFSAHHGPIPINVEKWPINRSWAAGRAVVDKVPVHLPDIFADDAGDFDDSRELSLKFDGTNIRSVLSVPLLRENESIGAITLRRTEQRAFDDKQITLLQTFADQAVIAIGNVRLFDEVQERTRDLTESLQFQTASADVLKVISRSPDTLQPVLDVIVQTSRELCYALTSVIFLLRDSKFHLAAVSVDQSFQKPGYIEDLRNNPISPHQVGSVLARATNERRTVHIPNTEEDPEAGLGGPMDAGGPKALLCVPLTLDDRMIGAITLRQSHLAPFTQRQIEAVESFADQAVIAISNVNLFEQVQARTRDLQESLQQQTATADVLKVISRSAFDLQTVLDTLVESAARLCEADMSVITRQRGDTYYRAGSWGFAPEFMEYVKDIPIKAERATITGRTLLEGKVTHVHDTYADPDYSFPEAQRLSGDPRTILGVPLLREGRPVGALALLRKNVRPFTDKQIELVTTFADQAVIAIENVRLFDEVQARTRELAKSLDDLRTAQDRLVQTEKLASLGQLTAGIAHEIKNPLNFVNNFAALSAELTDELKDSLKPAVLDETIRAEVDEITGMLKDNLSKVVQHGKRADSIVKNMLLHSRDGSGEHRPADINALVDESLNLAYHGARAEKPQFNVTLRRNFDPEAGMVDVFPQEITRVFLNLLSNGFYAVTKRRAANGTGFEPVVSALTKGRSDGVEIRIRDNGTGIPPDVKEKMFNPFFTTKPAGEGTGLGLSMSYDIIVKQHGGTIDVATVPGEFTEFTIVLPRTSVSRKN